MAASAAAVNDDAIDYDDQSFVMDDLYIDEMREMAGERDETIQHDPNCSCICGHCPCIATHTPSATGLHLQSFAMNEYPTGASIGRSVAITDGMIEAHIARVHDTYRATTLDLDSRPWSAKQLARIQAFELKNEQRAAITRALRGNPLLVNFEVGVGKTVVGCISAGMYALCGRMVLLITPIILIRTWIQEFKFCYGERLRVVHVRRQAGDMGNEYEADGTARFLNIYVVTHTEDLVDANWLSFTPGSIVIMSARMLEIKADLLSPLIERDFLVLDENDVRSVETNKARNLRRLKPKQTILLSASLFQNYVRDLWVATSWVIPPTAGMTLTGVQITQKLTNKDIDKALDNEANVKALLGEITKYIMIAKSNVAVPSEERAVAGEGNAQDRIDEIMATVTLKSNTIKDLENNIRDTRAQLAEKPKNSAEAAVLTTELNRLITLYTVSQAEREKGKKLLSVHDYMPVGMQNALIMVCRLLMKDYEKTRIPPRVIIFRHNTASDATIVKHVNENLRIDGREPAIGYVIAGQSKREIAERNEAIRRFDLSHEDSNHLDVLIVAYAVGATGLNFRLGTAVIALAQYYNPEIIYRQAYGRIRRTGNTQAKTSYFILFERGSISHYAFLYVLRKLQARTKLFRAIEQRLALITAALTSAAASAAAAAPAATKTARKKAGAASTVDLTALLSFDQQAEWAAAGTAWHEAFQFLKSNRIIKDTGTLESLQAGDTSDVMQAMSPERTIELVLKKLPEGRRKDVRNFLTDLLNNRQAVTFLDLASTIQQDFNAYGQRKESENIEALWAALQRLSSQATPETIEMEKRKLQALFLV